jgi:hypothetical protein
MKKADFSQLYDILREELKSDYNFRQQAITLPDQEPGKYKTILPWISFVLNVRDTSTYFSDQHIKQHYQQSAKVAGLNDTKVPDYTPERIIFEYIIHCVFNNHSKGFFLRRKLTTIEKKNIQSALYRFGKKVEPRRHYLKLDDYFKLLEKDQFDALRKLLKEEGKEDQFQFLGDGDTLDISQIMQLSLRIMKGANPEEFAASKQASEITEKNYSDEILVNKLIGKYQVNTGEYTEEVKELYNLFVDLFRAGMFSIPDPDKTEEHAYKKMADIFDEFAKCVVYDNYRDRMKQYYQERKRFYKDLKNKITKMYRNLDPRFFGHVDDLLMFSPIITFLANYRNQLYEIEQVMGKERLSKRGIYEKEAQKNFIRKYHSIFKQLEVDLPSKADAMMEYFLQYQISILTKIWKSGDIENRFIKISSENILKII